MNAVSGPVHAVRAPFGVRASFIAATGRGWFGVCPTTALGLVTAVTAPALGLEVALPAHYAWELATFGHLGLVYLATLSLRRRS